MLGIVTGTPVCTGTTHGITFHCDGLQHERRDARTIAMIFRIMQILSMTTTPRYKLHGGNDATNVPVYGSLHKSSEAIDRLTTLNINAIEFNAAADVATRLPLSSLQQHTHTVMLSPTIAKIGPAVPV